MARRRRHRRHYSLSGTIRRSFKGFMKLGLGSLITTLGAYITSILSGHLSFTLGNTTVDLGFVPGIIITGAGLFVFITGLSEVLNTKI